MKPVQTRKISGGSQINAYPSNRDGRLKFVVVTLNYSYPEKGVAINQGRVEGVFVLEGSLKITLNGVVHNCPQGEVLYFEEGDKYAVAGRGKAIVAISPANKGETIVQEG
ncbi:MAG: hypothetical protein JW991_03310 [Candidatus Pacebacteria bacterium]|nr:hypothetical protein [Candidatus Paceibacterota bacterium]